MGGDCTVNERELERYQCESRRVHRHNIMVLAALSVGLAMLWAWAAGSLTVKERRLWDKVRAAEDFLYQWRLTLKSDYDPKTDPQKTGLIGVEWSDISTTLGSLSAKRTACDPRWSVIFGRWMDSLGVHSGDTVVVFSSSSFPGLILNILTALESHGIKFLFVLSLGASNWGANDPAAAWPAMAKVLREKGFLAKRPDAFTLGDDNENGGGLSEEGIAMLRKIASDDASGPLVVKNSLEEMILWKMKLIEDIKPKVVISLGGSHANLGSDEAILKLPSGLLNSRGDGGNGVIGRALRAGYPVVHMLNLKSLSTEVGIPFDAVPSKVLYGRRGLFAGIAALALFIGVLAWYRRWRME